MSDGHDRVAWLVVVAGGEPSPGTVVTVPYEPGRRLVIGRSHRVQVCDLRVTGDGVARRHTHLEAAADSATLGWSCVDGGSVNGTYVNDDPIACVALRDGDVVALGSACALRFFVGPGAEARAGAAATDAGASPEATVGSGGEAHAAFPGAVNAAVYQLALRGGALTLLTASCNPVTPSCLEPMLHVAFPGALALVRGAVRAHVLLRESAADALRGVDRLIESHRKHTAQHASWRRDSVLAIGIASLERPHEEYGPYDLGVASGELLTASKAAWSAATADGRPSVRVAPPVAFRPY